MTNNNQIIIIGGNSYGKSMMNHIIQSSQLRGLEVDSMVIDEFRILQQQAEQKKIEDEKLAKRMKEMNDTIMKNAQSYIQLEDNPEQTEPFRNRHERRKQAKLSKNK